MHSSLSAASKQNSCINSYGNFEQTPARRWWGVGASKLTRDPSPGALRLLPLPGPVPVTQNSSQIVFSYSVTFRIFSQNSFSLHPAGRFQLQFVSLRSTTISPCTRVAGTPEAFLFRPFRRASHLHFWYLLFPLLFRCVV